MTNHDRILIYVRGRFELQGPPPVVVTGDDLMDLGDIGIQYNNPGAAAANSTAFASYLLERADKPLSLRVSGPQSTNPARNNKREPDAVYFEQTLAPIIGGAGQPSSFALYGEGARIINTSIAGNQPIMSLTRTTGTTPQIWVSNLVFDSDGVGIDCITPGSTTFLPGVSVTYRGRGVISQDDFSDLTTAGYALRVRDADGLFVDGFFGTGPGHGVLVERWNAGRFQGNCRECGGIGLKGQNMASVVMDGRFESNTGYGLYIRRCGMNEYSGGAKVAQDNGPAAWQLWLENNNGRGSQHAQTSGGYQYTQAKVESSGGLIIAGHTGWASNMWRITEGSRNNLRLAESMRISQSAAPNFELVTNNTVSANVSLPADNFGTAAITNWDSVWTNASFRPTAVKIGTPGTDERIRLTWPASCFENTANPTSAYWRPFGALPLSSPGTFMYEVEYSDITGSGPAWCESREAAIDRQSPRIGSFHIAPVNGGQAYAPIWNTARRKLMGRIVISDARSDISPGFDAWFPGMEQKTGGAGQPSSIVYDIHQWRFWKIA